MRTKKKILSFILSITMLIGLIPGTSLSAMAADTKNALSTTATGTLKSGDTFTATFTELETMSEVSSYEAGIAFDKDVLEVTDVKAAYIEGTGQYSNTDVKSANRAGEASTNVMSASAEADMTVPAGEELLTLTFKVKDDVKTGTTTLSVKKYLIASLTEAGLPKDITPSNIGKTEITLNIQGTSSQTDITDTMKVEFTNKKMPYGDRYGKVPETKITAGDVILVEGTDYTVEGAGNYKWNGGWPYVGGQDCTVKISPVEGSKYTFTANEWTFTTKSNQDSLTIAYKDGQTLSKDYDGTPVAIEYNENAKLSKNDTDPLKIMTMTNTRASEGGQFVYVDGSGSANKIVWTFYTDEACTQKTTKDNGADAEGGAPSKAGNYWVKASLAADNAKIWTAAESNALAFTINQLADWDVNVEKIADQTYTGAAIEPEVVVTDNTGKTLVKDTDYTVSYLNNVNAGTATARVKSADGKSAKEVTFKINPIELTKDNVTVEAKDVQYNYGSAITPKITVKLDGNALSDDDYTATLKSEDKLINAGKYTLKYEIKGKGNCSGTVEAEAVLTIGKAPIGANVYFNGKKICDAGNESFTLADQAYTGKAIEPGKFTLDDEWYSGRGLKEGTDYTVTYTDNTNVGTATVTIKPAESGNYFFEGYDEGTVIDEITGTFNIVDSYGIIPVEDKINAIGNVTLDSATAINEARTAYDALDKDAQQYVSNYETLTKAEATLEKLLKAEDEALADVIQKINDIGTVTLESEDAINAARTAYDKLSDANKAKVTNYSVLTDAEAALKELWKDDNITCYVRAESDDGTILPLTKVTMNKHNVPSFSSYAIKNAPDQDKNYVTSLHILLQALTNRNMTAQLATIDIQSSGWINDMFGWGQDNLWCINGIDPPKMSCNYEAKDGETYVFYQAYGNWGAGFGYTGYGFFGEFGPGQDYTPHSAIETTEMTKEVGEAADFKYLYTSSMHTPQYGSCNNEDGAYTMVFVGKDGEETVTDEDYREDINVDKDGKFQVTFDKPGTYIVSARYYNSDNTRGASNAYCKVTVKDTYGVVNLIDKINKIGTVTLDSEEAINEARIAYDALPEEVKARVSNYNTLTAAEATLAQLKADQKAAAEVDQKISAIGEVTLDSEDMIKAARDAYEALTEVQKQQVTKLNTLTTAESDYKKLVEAEKKKVSDTISKINNIGDVTLNSESAIKEARDAYNEIAESYKQNVTNYDTLTKAEATLDQLKADKAEAEKVDKKIDAIGEVTIDSEKAIKEARAAYDKLTDSQKSFVTKLDALTAAEAKLTKLICEVKVVPSAPTVEVSSKMNTEKQKLAESMKIDLTDKANQALSDSVSSLNEKYRDAEFIKKELQKKGITVGEDDVVVVSVEPRLSMKVTDIVTEAGKKEVSADIEMLYNVYVTVNGGEKIALVNDAAVSDKDCKSIDITLELPNNIFSEAEVQEKGGIYVEHVKENGSVYYHKATLKDGTGDAPDTVTFTNDKGYSKFTVKLGKIPEDKKVTDNSKTTDKNNGNSVKTGDTANMVLPLCIMFIAAAVAGFCVVTMIRRKKRS